MYYSDKMAIIMPEEPRCPICLGEFNNTDCIPYIGCQKGGHAFCKGCIRDMILNLVFWMLRELLKNNTLFLSIFE